MLGAIAGDIIGSPYEADPIKRTDFPLFSHASTYTDDSVLTIALADSILSAESYLENLKQYAETYPNVGYGPTFIRWARSNSREPYSSYGNGSAMRVSPVAWAYDTLEEVVTAAGESSAVTHNHPEGVKGAQATAAAIFLARTGSDREAIRSHVRREYGYSLEATLDQIRPAYSFDMTCQGTVPVAILAFLESTDWEHAVRLAVSLGGDSDTLACITGSIAEAFYGGVPAPIATRALEILGRSRQLVEVTEAFRESYACP